MELVPILEKTISPEQHELEAAQQYLEQAAAKDFPFFLVQLATVLADSNNDNVPRMAAGLQLKNALTSKIPEIRLQYQQRWLTLDVGVRHVIKERVLQTLGTENTRPSSAAQCVAYIACSEIPTKQWPELIQHLVQNVTQSTGTEVLKESTLEAIGYICQDIEPEHLESQCNEILTAIVQGMRVEEESTAVKFAATTALQNSLEFTKANFEKETERHFIMQVVCEATQCKDIHVRVAALQCLVKIVSLYYHHMECYMGPALFAISVEAMKSDIDEISLQGIEFWSNVCDEEMDLAIEASEANEQGRAPEHISRFYAKGALQYLVPILTLKLVIQDENDDDDEWNPCKAAGVCLMLLANCCENDIVAHIVPFIRENFENPDWKKRDAAVMCFGSILEGPDPEQLKPLVTGEVEKLITCLSDQSVVVQDTVAWTLGRICELLPDAVLNDQNFEPLLIALVKSLDAEPRVAANICWAFSSLAEAAYETALNISPDGEEPKSYCLSPNFEIIIEKLLATTGRTDAHQANLRNAAYEALMELMKNSAEDCYGIVQATTTIILERISIILQMEPQIQTASDRMQYNDLQSLLCATLQSVLRRMKREDVLHISDQVMVSLLDMFKLSSGRPGGIQEDALLTVGTLVEVLGMDFYKYLEAFKEHLFLGLQNYIEHQVCIAAVGLVGDICRAMTTQIMPLCNDIMRHLLTNLRNEQVHRSVKPQILSVFGDIALAIGQEFRVYLPLVLETLQQASQTKVDKTDYDMVDCLNDLREGCLEAYTGIIQGLKGEEDVISPELQMVLSNMTFIVPFIEDIAADSDHTDGNVAACIGLIGDLCTTFRKHVCDVMERPLIQEILQQGRRSKVNKTKQLALWATKESRRLISPQH